MRAAFPCNTLGSSASAIRRSLPVRLMAGCSQPRRAAPAHRPEVAERLGVADAGGAGATRVLSAGPLVRETSAQGPGGPSTPTGAVARATGGDSGELRTRQTCRGKHPG